MNNQNDFFGYQSLDEYLNSNEFKQKIVEYEQSDEFKKEMRENKKNILKRKRQSVLLILRKNIFNILATILSTAALIVAILSYLK